MAAEIAEKIAIRGGGGDDNEMDMDQVATVDDITKGMEAKMVIGRKINSDFKPLSKEEKDANKLKTIRKK